MKEIFSAILLSISSNMDNILVGISYGSKNKKIPIHYILIIGIIVALVTSIAVLFGDFISGFIPQKFGKLFGSTTLLAIGVYNLFCLKKDSKKDEEIKLVSFKASIILGVFLSINNSIISIAASISGVNITVMVLSTFIFSTIFLIIGNIIGRRINTKIVEIITSVILILLGIYEYIF